MFLLDTCVISEGRRPLPDREVDAWFAAQDQRKLFLSSVSVGEIVYGIDLLDEGRKKNSLRSWFDETVLVGFAGRLLGFDIEAAAHWGMLRARYPNARTVDAQIAATALVHDLTLVTRNMKDFPFDGLAMLNPWKA